MRLPAQVQSAWSSPALTTAADRGPSVALSLAASLTIPRPPTQVPRSFWTRLAGKFGNKFYWQEKGEEASILSAVSAINTCLREPPGRLQCANIQGADLDEKPSTGLFGGKFGM